MVEAGRSSQRVCSEAAFQVLRSTFFSFKVPSVLTYPKPRLDRAQADGVGWALREMRWPTGRELGAVKSRPAFSARNGCLGFPIRAPLCRPAVTSALVERILDDNDVHRLLTLGTNPRNHAPPRLP
jgi:hypothetical protein